MDDKTEYKVKPIEERLVYRDFYCGICGKRWNAESDQKTLDNDYSDLILPSCENVESEEIGEDGEPVITKIHMKRRFRTVCYNCFFAISNFVELRKNNKEGSNLSRA